MDGTISSTPDIADQADFENARRWLALDLLAGRVDHGHPTWRWLLDVGADISMLHELRDSSCTPDIVGVNHS